MKSFPGGGKASAKALRYFLINHRFRILLTSTPKLSKFPLTVRWFMPQI